MHALLYFEKLDLYSGAAQLMRMQAVGLRARGVPTVIAAKRGGLRFFLATGIRVRTADAAKARGMRTRDTILVDHNMALPDADLVFVHNLASEANRYLPVPDLVRAAEEGEFFRRLGASTRVVANSALVRAALAEHFGIRNERVTVHHPGYQTARFAAEARPTLRANARRHLQLADGVPLVGFVTSGNFAKRGLDLFLGAAGQISAALPEVHFLVVGARNIPPEIANHALLASGRLVYRAKNHHPERWMAALDVFLYPARFEEFGMVVLEAAALGVPVLTSRRVGAAECLPPEYAPWLIAEPNPQDFAVNSMRLLEDGATRLRLGTAGALAARDYDDGRYSAATADTILAQKRLLK